MQGQACVKVAADRGGGHSIGAVDVSSVSGCMGITTAKTGRLWAFFWVRDFGTAVILAFFTGIDFGSLFGVHVSEVF